MKVVFKYPIDLAIADHIDVPWSPTSRVVLVDAQHPAFPALWIERPEVIVNPTMRRYQVFGTGQPIPLGAIHVGSVCTDGAPLVWHVYQVSS